jgi:NADH dehydrogenase (ubiquinone) Fe-S protein 2
MELYERSSGARMHSIFIRPGGLSKYISMQFLQDVLLFLENLYLRIDEIEDLLTKNRI